MLYFGPVLARWLAFLAAIFGSLLAGGMLLIRVVLVPIWQSAAPSEFRSWFRAYSDRTRRLMRPLGAASAATATGSAVAQAVTADGAARVSSVTAAAAAVGVAAVTLAVNEPANARFVGDGLSDDETVALLARWARWHDVRVALGVIGTLAAVRAVWAIGPYGRDRGVRVGRIHKLGLFRG